LSDTLNETITRRLLVKGKVQGVAYRISAQREAQRLGLRGWVRNRRDGDVEALVSGPAEAVFRLIEWCNDGPPAASVTRVEATEENVIPRETTFEIVPTA